MPDGCGENETVEKPSGLPGGLLLYLGGKENDILASELIAYYNYNQSARRQNMRRIINLLAVCLLCIFLSSCSDTNDLITETVAPVEQETVRSDIKAPVTTTEPAVPTEASVEAPTEPEPVAELISEGLKVMIDGENFVTFLSDGRYWSSRVIGKDQTLSVACTTPFAGMYFEWGSIPGIYSIVWDGGSLECGHNGFLHEYVQLPESVNQVTVQFQGEESQRLIDVEVCTAGTPPESVQAWLPPCEEADILVFPTHSDDDALFFGPLISYYAIERGLRVQTAFMVEHRHFPERDHERLNGLWEMGVRHYPILGTAPDTSETQLYAAKAFYESSNIEQWQVEQIRRFKPLVIVGHDLEGEYGNGGHKVNALNLVEAVESAADTEKFPESAQQYGVWDTPKLYLHLYEENEIVLDVNTKMSNDPAGRTPFEVAVAAYQYHESQHFTSYAVRQDGSRMYDCRFFGLYRTRVGYDTVPDIMENTDEVYWRQPDGTEDGGSVG